MSNKIDEHIKKLDFDLRRVGRISKKEIEQVLNEINVSSEFYLEFLTTRLVFHIIFFIFFVETATPSQSLMVLRCCGNLVPDELPENRTILVQKIWQAINQIGMTLFTQYK